MSELDALNVAVARYFKRNPRKWSSNLQDVKFSGFKAYQGSDQLIAQLWGKADGQWFHTNIVVSKECFLMGPSSLFEILRARIDAACKMLDELAEDDFTRWVKQTREENERLQLPEEQVLNS